MFEWLTSWIWRSRAKKIPKARCSICIICNEPIVPGNFVGETADGALVHAGFHKSAVTGKDAFCESGGIGIGFWNGERVEYAGPSLAARVLESGEPMVGVLGPNGLETRVPENTDAA